MKVHFVGDVQASHSLSIMARPVVVALSKEYDISIQQWGFFPQNLVNDQYTDIINALCEKPQPQLTDQDFEIRCKFPLNTLPPDHKAKIISWTPWELDHLPIQFTEFFNRYATAVVGVCPYNAEVFNKTLTNPVVHHIPPPIHQAYWDAENGPTDEETTILYDAGATWRKGSDIFMQLMKRFAGMPEVKFIWKDTKIYNSFMFPEIQKLNVTCEYIIKDYTFEQMANLYKRSDIIVYPTRAEGFGYCPAQGLVMGKHVVSPNHTGLNYVTDNNSFVVDCDAVECHPNNILSEQFGYTFDQPVHVAEPNQGHLYAQVVRAMATKSPKQSREHLLRYMSRYTDEFVSNMWMEFLEELK